jgi:hypothetical protein
MGATKEANIWGFTHEGTSKEWFVKVAAINVTFLV